MTAHSNPTGASLIPTLRYRNVGAAIAWLQKAFGLEPHRIVKDSQGRVLYGELTFGTGMVMVAPVQESPFGRLMVQPDEIGGVETQVCYLFVDDARAHYARAKAAGAAIVLDVDLQARGGRGYSCRDPEGHLWNFGTYDPWDLRADRPGSPSRRTRKILAACMILAVAGGACLYGPARDTVRDLAGGMLAEAWRAVEPALAGQPIRTAANEAVDPTARAMDLREELARERRAREAAEFAAQTAREAQDRIAKAAESAATEARNALADLRSKLEAATEELSRARMAEQAAERNARQAREEFARLDDARESAERTARWARNLAARERRRRIVAERTLRIARQSPNTPYPLN